MRRWKHEMPETRRTARIKKILVYFICTLIIAAVSLTAVYLRRLHSATVSSDVSVSFQSETLSITWDASFEMDACRVFQYDENSEKYVSYGEYQNGLIMMDPVEAGKEIKLRLQAVKYVKLLGHKIAFFGFPRDLTLNPAEITTLELQVSVNPDDRQASITWQGSRGCIY